MFRLITVALLTFCIHSLEGGVVVYGNVGGGTRVSLPGPNFIIPASFGKQKGGNLFESFSQFNLNSSQSATYMYFRSGEIARSRGVRMFV